MTFGLKLGQVKARELRPDGLGTRFVLEAQGERVSTRLSLIGNHNVLNALAAVSAGLTLGVPLRNLAKRLKSFISQAPMRMEIKNMKGVLFINDAYNASPTSVEAALVTFEDLQGSKRKLAVLGDMLELGFILQRNPHPGGPTRGGSFLGRCRAGGAPNGGSL